MFYRVTHFLSLFLILYKVLRSTRNNLLMHTYTLMQFWRYEFGKTTIGNERKWERDRNILLWPQDHQLGRLLPECSHSWCRQIRFQMIIVSVIYIYIQICVLLYMWTIMSACASKICNASIYISKDYVPNLPFIMSKFIIKKCRSLILSLLRQLFLYLCLPIWTSLRSIVSFDILKRDSLW